MMGQWRLAFTFRKQFGILISFTSFEIVLELPFMQIYIGLTKEAEGINFFQY